MKTPLIMFRSTLLSLLFGALGLPCLCQEITIPIIVIDFGSGSSVENVEVYSYDRQNNLVLRGKTNSEGRFGLKEKQFGPGDQITIILERSGYRRFFRSFPLSRDPSFNRKTFRILPEIGEGPMGEIMISGDVRGGGKARKRGRRVLKDYNMSFIDVTGIQFEVKNINDKGYFLFTPIAGPGQKIRLNIDGGPKYKVWESDYTVKEQDNYLNVQLEKRYKVPPQCYAWGAAALLAGSAVYHKLESNRLYSDHKDPFAFDSHDDWLSTYRDAKRAQDWYVYSSAGAGLCVGVGILIKCLVKNKPRAGNTSSSTGINLSRVSGLACNIDGPCLGLVYHF